MFFFLLSDWKTAVSIFFDLHLPSSAPNIFFCFSNHKGAVFFSFFLLLSLPSSFLRWHNEEGNFLFECDQSNWLFLRRIIFRSALLSPTRSKTRSLVAFYDHLIFPILLQHPFSKLSNYILLNFLSIVSYIYVYIYNWYHRCLSSISWKTRTYIISSTEQHFTVLRTVTSGLFFFSC